MAKDMARHYESRNGAFNTIWRGWGIPKRGMHIVARYDMAQVSRMLVWRPSKHNPLRGIGVFEVGESLLNIETEGLIPV